MVRQITLVALGAAGGAGTLTIFGRIGGVDTNIGGLGVAANGGACSVFDYPEGIMVDSGFGLTVASAGFLPTTSWRTPSSTTPLDD